jgi:dTDP-4-dehydrorhamnose reductase|tara:strand:+ start:330 stop:1067 length:738 start_codon:yes stop_codon:yes gene_type:complete
MTKILITGGDGEFCKHLVREGKDLSFLTPSKKEADIRDYWQLDRYFYTHQSEFDVVIHAGAITRPMVIHEDNPKLSIKTNIIGTSNVVLMCERYNKKIVYISTDYVYEGTDGNYKEKDALKPFTKYGWSKLGGECAVQMYDNHLILRMAMNKKPFPHPKALIDMKKSLMWIKDAANVTLKLLDETGTVNVGGKSQSVYDFVKEENPKIKPILLDDIPDVNMATDCSMDTTKMKMLLKVKKVISEH